MLNQALWSEAEMTVMLAHKRAYLGMWGEEWLKGKLERCGYQVSNAHKGEFRGDLRVVDQVTGEVFRLEVKTARAGKDKRYRFCLRKKGHTDIAHADYVALLCVSRWGTVTPYLAPVTAFGDVGGVSIGQAGKWDSFKVSEKNLRLGATHG